MCLQEVVQQYKDKMKEINVRPIKKVVEAKARKKRRTMRRMEKARKKADTISETMGISDYDKAQQIRQYVSIFFFLFIQSLLVFLVTYFLLFLIFSFAFFCYLQRPCTFSFTCRTLVNVSDFGFLQ
jgi:hypothetical protein